jgi:1-acylglycerone phosphate reductase
MAVHTQSLYGLVLTEGANSVTVTSILRTTSVSDSVKNQSDITFNFIERGMWTLIEINIGIMTACLPVLKEPLVRAFPRALGGSRMASRHTASRDNYVRAYSLPQLSSPGQFSGNGRDTGSKKGRTVVTEASYLEETRWSDEQHIISSSVEGSAADLGSAKEEHHGRTTGS